MSTGTDGDASLSDVCCMKRVFRDGIINPSCVSLIVIYNLEHIANPTGLSHNLSSWY